MPEKGEAMHETVYESEEVHQQQDPQVQLMLYGRGQQVLLVFLDKKRRKTPAQGQTHVEGG